MRTACSGLYFDIRPEADVLVGALRLGDDAVEQL